jgi:hypothetical protein
MITFSQKHFNKIVRGFEAQGWQPGFDRRRNQCMLITDDGRKCAAGMLATKKELATPTEDNYAVVYRFDGVVLAGIARAHDAVAMTSKNFRRDLKSKLRGIATEHGFKIPPELAAP